LPSGDKLEIVIAMNTESRPGGDDVLDALNALARTLDSELQPTAAAHDGTPANGDGEFAAGGQDNGADFREQSDHPSAQPGDGGGRKPPAGPPGGNAAAGESPDPDPGIWIVLPNGMRVNTNDLLRRSEAMGESAIRASVLKPGDLVMFSAHPQEGSEHMDRTRGAAFEVSSVEWTNVAPGVLPQARVKGTLRSTDLPPGVANQEVELIGSGFGGSTVRSNVLATDLPPYFKGPDRETIILDDFTFTDTYRPTDDGIENVGPNQLEQQARTDNPRHTECVDALVALGATRGIDMRKPPEAIIATNPTVVRSDGEAYALFSSNVQSGNVITALERAGKTWTQARYVNTGNRDLLQVTIANLSGVNIRETFPLGIQETSAVNASRVPTLSFTTSNLEGIDVMQFRPGIEDTIQELGMPPHPGGRTYQPSINISPDGNVSIENSGPVGVVFKENPGLAERMTAAVRVETDTEGNRTLTLGSKRYTLPSQEAIMQRITNIVEGGR
jgi:hypothetical protein